MINNCANIYTPSLLKKVQETELSILKDFIEVAEKYNIDWFLAYGSAIGAVRHKGFIPWDDDIDIEMLRKDYEKFEKVFNKELSNKYNLINPEKEKNFSASVTHMELKGTKFVSQDAISMKHQNGLYLDIFVLDKVAKNPILRWHQYSKCYILGRLIFLYANEKPFIPYEGIKKSFSLFICKIVHKLLNLFNLNNQKLYRKLQKSAQKYNDTNSNQYSTLEDYLMKKNTVLYDDIFPLKVVSYEDIKAKIMNNYDKNLTNIYGNYMKIPPKDKQINHRPILIKFN